MESMKSFQARVKRETGISLNEIPVVEVPKNDFRDFPGRIFCRRDNVYVIATGYPEVTEEGEEWWAPEAFRVFVV